MMVMLLVIKGTHRPQSMNECNDKLTKKIIGCAIKVHRALDPGLLESTYEIRVRLQVGCPSG